MRLQRQLSNGRYVDVAADSVERFLNMVVEFDHNRKGNDPRYKFNLTGPEDAIAKLEAGHELRYDTDWYASIRDGEAHERKLTERRNREANDPKRYPDGRMLDCGHVVYHASHVMSASSGTSCTDCYDRMS